MHEMNKNTSVLLHMLSDDDKPKRKEKQGTKPESLLSTNTNLLLSLDLMSPIGKIRQRQPGPITSTPRISATVRSDLIYRSNRFDKLSHIHELKNNEMNFSVAHEKKQMKQKRYCFTSREKRTIFTRLQELIEVAVFLVVLWIDASPLQFEKREKRHDRQIAAAKDLHEVLFRIFCISNRNYLEKFLLDPKISGQEF
uniref:BHLH domain-containing protein n=1 Tax=Elaeophora elaphi TaxID=1147741 RepID=A0A0R3RGU9_9BILA